MCRSKCESSFGLMGWALDADQKALGCRSEAAFGSERRSGVRLVINFIAQVEGHDVFKSTKR